MKQHLETLTIAGGLGVLAFVGYKLLSGRQSNTASPKDADAGMAAITARQAARNLLDPNAYYLANGGRNTAMNLDRWDAIATSYQPANFMRQ